MAYQIYQASHPTSHEDERDDVIPDKWYVVDKDCIPEGGPYETEEEARKALPFFEEWYRRFMQSPRETFHHVPQSERGFGSHEPQ